ncbi:hypothetical protein [Rheinheimera sp. 4Y26]|uniref:hypothetical protein n=1 Tax=Rheinheimera sp. 4Y26 TaxID=2977811 RepID=UPI0021B10753|nr:hypothetical protein [Rheinheimera sp. 4Y26]MCT6701444.1 hypothetical protein [Rheinheimera sp. 4Y26]
MHVQPIFQVVACLSVWLLCPAVFATSYNNWPELQQSKDKVYKQCHSKHNSGTDAENFYQCQTQQLLQDFPMPAGQDTECAAKAGKNASGERYQQNIYQCLQQLVSDTSKYKNSIAKMLAHRPELAAGLKSCEQAFDASGQPYANKWLQINSCLKKAAHKTKSTPATSGKPVLTAKPAPERHSHQQCENYAKDKEFSIAVHRNAFMTRCRLSNKPMDEIYAIYKDKNNPI